MRGGFNPRRQRGVALLVALLVVALAVVLVAGLLDRGELALARTRNAMRAQQVRAYVQGMEAYAARVLLEDLGNAAGMDSNADIWAMPLPPQDVPGGLLSAVMRDANGCFNVNNLASGSPDAPVWRRWFARLLMAHGADAKLADAVTQWLDSEGRGATDSYYLAQPQPYRSGGQPFAHASELRLVRGFDAQLWQRIGASLCALPPGTRLNVNTASPAVLQSIDAQGRITEAVAHTLWQDGQAQWGSVAEFDEQLRQQSIALDPAMRRQLGVVSNYFILRADIELDGVPYSAHSLLERRVGSGIRVLARNRDADALLY